ncbi:ras-related protein Rab-37-like [Physella acuta]|uniref:ras-related protein Rab-37-like n=1 Tax=Physella acuta TaxID=109671 RepID=UPI0027DBE822|nr:ras-related protein Rab-37-like [Physella acuta]
MLPLSPGDYKVDLGGNNSNNRNDHQNINLPENTSKIQHCKKETKNTTENDVDNIKTATEFVHDSDLDNTTTTTGFFNHCGLTQHAGDQPRYLLSDRLNQQTTSKHVVTSRDEASQTSLDDVLTPDRRTVQHDAPESSICDDVKARILELSCKESYDLKARVILLGDYSVGKTSFLRTLASSREDVVGVCCKEYVPGEVAVVICVRDEERALVRVMDTGGQEKYRSLTSSYYRGVHGCLLMFDVRRETTFDSIIGWYQELVKNAQNDYVCAILVGTTSHTGQRMISSERGFRLADNLDIPYMECSTEDELSTCAIVQRLLEKIRLGVRRKSFNVEIKPHVSEIKKSGIFQVSPNIEKINCMC